MEGVADRQRRSATRRRSSHLFLVFPRSGVHRGAIANVAPTGDPYEGAKDNVKCIIPPLRQRAERRATKETSPPASPLPLRERDTAPAFAQQMRNGAAG